jgi:hypothetical protein
MPKDVNQLAYRTMELSTQEPKEPREPKEPKEPKEPGEPKEPNVSKSIISRVMSEMGKKGGKISGKRRMANIPPERRREIALKAAQARWKRQ